MTITGFDPARNFAIADLASGITNVATSITLATGKGALFPDPSADGAFNVPLYNSTDYTAPWLDPDVEIVRVTAKSTDTFTVTRAQEGTSAVAHNTGGKTYSLYMALTRKAYDDLITALIAVRGVTLGGTGAATFTDGGVLIGNGTGAVQATSAGTAGQVLTSNGTGVDPTFQTASGGTVDNGVQNFRLTLVTGTPVMTTDQTAKTTVYLTPYTGNRIALYDGSSAWSILTSAEVSLSLSGYTADKNYDIWAYNNSGTLTLDSTVWTNDTTRATALAYQDGVLVKSGTTTRRYIGTIRITGTTGQTEFTIAPTAATGGTNNKLFLWNYYNRIPLIAICRDDTNSWTYSSATWRNANNSASNRVSFVTGVAESSIDAVYNQLARCSNGYVHNGIGYDSASAISGFSGIAGSDGVAYSKNNAIAEYTLVPSAGFHYMQALELTDSGSTDPLYYGDGLYGNTALYIKTLY